MKIAMIIVGIIANMLLLSGIVVLFTDATPSPLREQLFALLFGSGCVLTVVFLYINRLHKTT